MGCTIRDFQGLIQKRTSYWSIDESGNPSRVLSENGKYYTLSAVTGISEIDFERLFKDVPLIDGEVHFHPIERISPEICIGLTKRLGESPVLVLYKTVVKIYKHIEPQFGSPTNELFVSMHLMDILSAIAYVDSSPIIVVTFDDTSDLSEYGSYQLAGKRCILTKCSSDESKLVQIADITASSIHKAELPEPKGTSVYFDNFRENSVKIDRTDDEERVWKYFSKSKKTGSSSAHTVTHATYKYHPFATIKRLVRGKRE